MTDPTSDSSYVVVGNRPWSRVVFDEVISKYPRHWHFIDRVELLTAERLGKLSPRYVFFLHWSLKVPDAIVRDFECVCFHMTDVPFGRGGSPLQNLIMRGLRSTKLTALRMTADFDAGPVYLKDDLSLEGGAEEIYIRACRLAAAMIGRILREQPAPSPQTGEPVVFKRRKASQSEVPELTSLGALHDFIRMLDADGYPRAFLNYRGFRYEFSRAGLYSDAVVADVRITRSAEIKQ